MACRALIDHVQIPKDRVHRIRGELPPHEAAAVYRAELKIPRSESTGPLATSRAAALGRRRFDVILLGLGPDGHTASLFPGTEAVRERRQDAVAVYVERLDAWRVTLTLRIINDARHVIFLVSGEGKAEALARVHAGENLPAGLVQPTEGSVAWLVDRDAAAKLPPGRSGGPADPV
jgi:6-phosphogluconolactonase